MILDARRIEDAEVNVGFTLQVVNERVQSKIAQRARVEGEVSHGESLLPADLVGSYLYGALQIHLSDIFFISASGKKGRGQEEDQPQDDKGPCRRTGKNTRLRVLSHKDYSSSKSTVRLRPAAFASYRARSAFWINDSTVTASDPEQPAIPRLAVVRIS